MDRRSFLKTSAAAGVGIANAPLVRTAARTQKKYRTALIGSGWWGMNILRTGLQSGTVTPVGLCDVDTRQLDPAAEEVASLSGDKPRRYGDYREMLAAEKPEIVIVATPDHWHALNAIDALETGAHIYLEKPISHTLNEGRAIVEAARRYGGRVQVGTHRRISPHNVSGMEFLKSGKVGKIGMVRSFVHYGGGPGEKTPDSEPPPELDWNMWCGPAPLRPFNERIHPRGFRQFLDFANGQIGDWGIHWLDQVLWWTDETAPISIHSVGDRHIKEDSTDSPDTQLATFEFESFTATWEHRQYAANNAEQSNIGCYFYGTEGTFHMGWRDGWTFYPSNKSGQIIHADAELDEPDHQNIRGLWDDLIGAIESGGDTVCTAEIGHRSSSMSLLAMASMRLGRSIRWDGERERAIGDEEANRLLSRPYRKPWVYPVF